MKITEKSRRAKREQSRRGVTLPAALALLAALILWTLPVYGEAPGSFRFVVMADSIGYKRPVNTAALTYIVYQILDLTPRPAFVVFCGDMGFHGGTKVLEYWKTFIKPLTNAGIKVYVAVGNHELHDIKHTYTLEHQQEYQQAFHNMPDNGPPGYQKLVYAFEYGNAFFAILDSFYMDPVTKVKHKNQFTREQLDWLENQLKKTRAEHKFAFAHSPVFFLEKPEKQDPSRLALWKIMDDHNFDIFFSGHEHLYSRLPVDSSMDSRWKNRVTQIVAGGAGAPLIALFRVHMSKSVANVKSLHNFVVVDVKGDQVYGHTYGVVKRMEDEYTPTYATVTIEQFTISKPKK